MSSPQRLPPQRKPVYVFDTNIFVAALRSRRGASFVILNAIRQEAIVGAASQALLLEYADVLLREDNIEQFWADEDEVETILGVLADQLDRVKIHYRWRPQLSDPDDEMVLECAINAQASAIVTFNKRDFLPNAALFGIEIISPSEFIKRFNLTEKLKP